MGIMSSLIGMSPRGNVESLAAGMPARHTGSIRKLWRAAFRNMGEVRMAPVKGGTITRQRRRSAAFAKAFAQISMQYPGEPRRARRRMARAIMHREWEGR